MAALNISYDDDTQRATDVSVGQIESNLAAEHTAPPAVCAAAAAILAPEDVEVVLFHAPCCDGTGAAYAAWLVHGEGIDLIPTRIQDKPNLERIQGKNVAMFDMVFKEQSDMEAAMAAAANFIVLDHHKSNAEAYDGMYDNCFFDMSRSGAVLAWHYFHGDTEVPPLLLYVEDRDLWLWQMENSRAFSAGLDTYSLNVHTFHSISQPGNLEALIAKGSVIYEYQTTSISRALRKSVKRIFHGHECAVVNSTYWMSDVANALAGRAAVGLAWSYDGARKKYNISLRCANDDVDVSELAGIYGGGGHARAAGFTFGGASIEELFEE